jgi:exodeoxyribonuclease VII large subunit
MSDVPILSVTELTQQLKAVVEANFPCVWVVGEISNCTRAGSGHIYLTLKDDQSQIRAVVWRSQAARLKFDIHDGLEVIASGPVELYEARGTYQLIVERLLPKGIGALELAFRQLHEKLAAEGLFEPARKRPLPLIPRRIALVTSPSGAAVRDMLQVMTRRWPSVDVIIVPVRVQGEGAAQEIAAALRMVHIIPDVDVVIAGRGGGSLEDLWAFNEEVVARAIAACRLPVMSAVGHEIDVTIADLVADRRALTPSEAAEIVVPNRADVLHTLERARTTLCAALRDRAHRARLKFESLASRRVFTHPLERIHYSAARLDEIDVRLGQIIARRVERDRHTLAKLATSLDALSPLRVLERGYSITERAGTGEVIRSAGQLAPGDEIATLLSQGRVTSRVESVETEVNVDSKLTRSVSEGSDTN